MQLKCILCGNELEDHEVKNSILNYCNECSKLLILKNPKKIKLTKEEKKKKRINKIVKTLSKENNIFYSWTGKCKPRGIVQKELVNYLLEKYPEKIPFPEVIESIIVDETLKIDKKGKERYLSFTKVLNLFKALETKEIIKKI